MPSIRRSGPAWSDSLAIELNFRHPLVRSAAHHLQDPAALKPRNMLTQLAEWTRLGSVTRTRATASP
jgi:hypothetical protein